MFKKKGFLSGTIYDQVGRQVVWLMYYLEENKYTNYHFLAGGVHAAMSDQNYARVELAD